MPTDAPAAASDRAAARPRPVPAPVTSATRPAKGRSAISPLGGSMIEAELGTADEGPDKLAARLGARLRAAVLEVAAHQGGLLRRRRPRQHGQVRPAGHV